MTTTIVYPDAGTGGTTVDGHVRRSSVSESFSAIRTGSGVSHADTTALMNCVQLTADTTSNLYTVLRRSIFTFDTSSVPSGDVVSAVTFSLYGSAKTNGLGEPDLDVVSATPASNNDLVNGDYSYTNFGTSPYGSVAYGSYSTSGYNNISCSTGSVTKAGITRLGTRTSWDTDNSGPTWSSGAASIYECYFADQSGTTNDPKLTVVHAAAAISVDADLLSGALTVLDPSLSHTLTADLVDAALGLWEPAALRDWNVTPDVLDGSMTVLAPTFGLVVGADLLDGAMTVLEPAALQDWNVGPDVLDGSMTLLAPTLARVVYADLLDGAMTVLEPAALQDWNLAPDVLDGAMTLLAPAVNVGGLTIYGWLLGGYDLMASAHKIELLGEYDGLPGRRGDDLLVSGQEGRVWREKWHDERLIALRMYIRGDTRTQYQANIDALLAALGRSEEQTLRRGMADGSERQIAVRLLQALAFQPQSDRFARMVVEFTAAAPYWRQPDSTVVSVSGITPASLPYNFACNNSGSATDDAPTLTITPSGGTLTNPRLTLGSTWVQYTGSVTSGQVLSIDAGAWTATKAAANVANAITSAKPDWLLIPAGNNTATLSGTLSAGSVAVSVTFYPRWH